MSMKLEFKNIKNQDIFQPEFQDLAANGYGIIEFKKQPQASGGIAVVYAPNGTGKSSLTAVLGKEEGKDNFTFEAVYNTSNQIVPETKAFHIIGDQISRNVIEGETSDYLIGHEIKKEYKLKKKISEGFKNAFDGLNIVYKSEYGVTKIKDYILSAIQVRNRTAYTYIKDIVNKQAKGKNIDREEFVSYVRNPQNRPTVLEVDNNRKQFIIKNIKLIENLMQVDVAQIISNAEVCVIEQNDDAINILEKYKHLHNCIVCNNDNIDNEMLLRQKLENRKRIYESLDPVTKELLEKVAMDQSLLIEDPFEIKSIVLAFLESGEIESMQSLQSEINSYIDSIVNEMIIKLLDVFSSTSMYAWWDEYAQLLRLQPELDSEELLYIQEIISENIGRNIRLIRDDENDHNFKLMLDDQELLGLDRNDMHLSTGEQNFISLTFALLLARHSDREFVILDDPISSFDSVYKNKIAFCIVKFLEKKKQIVLTHNTDLIRLLDVQLKNCFSLYMLNNTEGGRNGFIPVKEAEKDILINLSALVKLFQNDKGILHDIIHDKKLFLMAMIPFLRGYIHIMKDPDDDYGRLSRIMHGYEDGSLDVAKIYKIAFGYEVEDTEVISVEDILNLSCTELDIIDSDAYPLLSDTLKQTLVYYHVRMKVEHELVDIFNIQNAQRDNMLLTDIIQKAFRPLPELTQQQKEKMRNNRVFFTSRKTLLNEFNHFEGNMNIFQPAIDITETALQREVTAIENKLIELRTEYAIDQ